MFAALTGRRGLRALLDDEEWASLEQVAAERRVQARQNIFEAGAAPGCLHLVLDGWIGRHRDLADGRRQYLAIHLAGDVCDLDRVMLGEVDFGAVALTPCKIAQIPLPDLRRLFDARPRLASVFWWMLSAENAIAGAWASSLGRRTARERLAHLLCEIAVRLGGPHPAQGSVFPLRLTQEDMANALGLSIVHLNRSLQTLRADGLIEVGGRRMRILDWEGLCRVAEFDAAYLHFQRPGPRGAAAAAAAQGGLGDLEAAEIRRRLKRREAELRELNHRIANSLQIAAGLLARQRSRLRDPRGREALAEARARLEAVGKLHRHLYQHSEVDDIDLKSFLEALCPDIASITDLGCSIHADPVIVPADVAQQIAIVVNELAMNARKHAYAGGAHGELRVECRARADHLVLSVADRGPGLGRGFSLGGGAGLGMTLVQGIAEQLGGALDVEDDQGARFTMTVPLPASQPRPAPH